MTCSELCKFLLTVRKEQRWQAKDIYPSSPSRQCFLFDIAFLEGQVLDSSEVAQQLQDAAQSLIYLLENGEDVRCDLLPLCCLYANPKYPIECRPDCVLRPIQFLHQLLPPVRELLSCSNPSQGSLQHAWLLLAGTQIAIITRFLPGSIDKFYKIVTVTLEGLLTFASYRGPTTTTQNVGSIGVPGGTFGGTTHTTSIGSCGCFKALWELVVCDVDGVSTSRSTEGFWSVYNKSFNHLADKESISTQFWVFERVADIVTITSPHTPPNWSPIQSLVQQSCNQPQHLPQALLSLTNLSSVWKPHIVIIMTLQQHFVRTLLSRQGTSPIVSILTPERYLTTIDLLIKHQTSGDTVFIRFLEFFIMSMDKIEVAKRMTLIRKVFDKIDPKALTSMSTDSLQNLGLLLGVMLSIVKPEEISDKMSCLLVSGDSVSNALSPEALINMYIALALLQSQLSVNCEVLLGQMGVMLNRLSEDYTRESGVKQSAIFSLIDKFMTSLACLLLPKHDTSHFFGSWIEMMLEDNNISRCSRVLNFVQLCTRACRRYEGSKDNMIASYQKCILKSLKKYHCSRSSPEVPIILANFTGLLNEELKLGPKHKPLLILVLDLILPKNSIQVALSVQFILNVLENEDEEVLSGYEQKVANTWLLYLLLSHVLNTLTTPENISDVSKLTIFVMKTSKLSDLELPCTDQNIPNIISVFITSLTSHYATLEFSQSQIFKNLIWKTFDNVTTALSPILSHEDDVIIKRLYSTLSDIMEELPLILHSTSKDTSPYTEIFQSFFSQQIKSKRPIIRKIIGSVLPKVFKGLSALSYRTNTVFFKEILKVFNDIYPLVSISDRKMKRNPPFLVTLFSKSLVESPQPSVMYFRQSFMNYFSDPRHEYCNLPKDPEELKNLLYFVWKLEERTMCRELVKFDTLKLYAFILQVFYTCVSLGPKAPTELKDMSRSILTQTFDHHTAHEILPQTKQFLHRNVAQKSGPCAVIRTFEEFLVCGGTSIVKCCLEELGLLLGGREKEGYDALEAAVLQTL